MVHNYFNGFLDNATKVQLESIELIKALFCEVNPIPVKAALNIMGYDYGTPRLPLIEMSSGNKEILKNAMKNYGI